MIKEELITPDQARQWLIGGHQHYVEWQKLLLYLDALTNDTWDLQRQRKGPIIIKDDKVKDGHHRLTFIAIYGKPVKCLVEYRDY